MASFYDGREVDVLFGNGRGAFGQPVALPTIAYTSSAAVTGDFNGDGRGATLITVVVSNFWG